MGTRLYPTISGKDPQHDQKWEDLAGVPRGTMQRLLKARATFDRMRANCVDEDGYADQEAECRIHNLLFGNARSGQTAVGKLESFLLSGWGRMAIDCGPCGSADGEWAINLLRHQFDKEVERLEAMSPDPEYQQWLDQELKWLDASIHMAIQWLEKGLLSDVSWS